MKGREGKGEKGRGCRERRREEGRKREGHTRHTHMGVVVKWPLSFCNLQHRFQVRGDGRDKVKNLSFSRVSPDPLSLKHKFGIFLRAARSH